MLRTKIKKLLIKMALIFTLTASILIPNLTTHKVYANTYNNTRIEQRIHTNKILIYHSHTCEKNIESSVVDVGEDLKLKLEKKGYTVEHITDDFVQGDYNNSYYHSKAMLQGKDLLQYDLIIDLHMDAGAKPFISKDKKGQDVAKMMFVNTKLNQHLENETKIANNIKDNMKQFGNSIMRENCVQYNKGINFYNLSMNQNMVLLEVGNDKNNKLETRRSITYLVSAINSYFENNK